MKYPTLALITGLSLLTAGPVLALDLAPNDKGIGIDTASTGSFTLEAPELTTSDGAKEKAVWEPSEKGGIAKYPSGASIEMLVISKEEVAVAFKELPEKGKSIMISMPIPVSFTDGGTVTAGEAETKPLPPEAGDQHVITGTVMNEFKLADSTGAGISIESPTNWYTVQDNRIWNDNKFVFQMLYDMAAQAGKSEFTIIIKDLK
jgi:hypothetical protein